MRFGILGPLQVVDSAGTPVVVPAAKQRIVLAALLLASGGTVSPARLAEALWDACPPPNAAAVMRTYVMRLRRVLGPAGARIVGQPAGLAVDLRDAGELDVAEVDLRWRAARAAATAGEWSRVSAELTTALSLWRGEPLADVPATRISPPRLRPWSRLTPRLLTITGADRQMPVPRQLPVSLPAFTSRAAELARLTELARQAAADGSAAISVISGMAGVGKTALAVHWAHQVTGLFHDGQLYANQTPKTFNAGEALTVPAGVIHAVRNAGSGNAAELAMYVVEKGKPLLTVAE